MSEVSRLRVVVAVSGQGRSLGNLLRYQEQHQTFEVNGVISSNEKCAGVELARKKSLPVFTDSFKGSDFPSEGLSRWLKHVEPDIIVLAGFLKKFPTRFSDDCPGVKNILNIHPSLLPKHGGPGMYGIKVHESVLESADVETGATIHRVTEVYDQGLIVAQVKVPVMPDDTAKILAARVFDAECKLLPETISQFAEEWTWGSESACLETLMTNRQLTGMIPERIS